MFTLNSTCFDLDPPPACKNKCNTVNILTQQVLYFVFLVLIICYYYYSPLILYTHA